MFVKTLKSNYKVFKTSGRQVGNGLLLKLNDELIKRKTEHEITSVIIDENRYVIVRLLVFCNMAL